MNIYLSTTICISMYVTCQPYKTIPLEVFTCALKTKEMMRNQ